MNTDYKLQVPDLIVGYWILFYLFTEKKSKRSS